MENYILQDKIVKLYFAIAIFNMIIIPNTNLKEYYIKVLFLVFRMFVTLALIANYEICSIAIAIILIFILEFKTIITNLTIDF